MCESHPLLLQVCLESTPTKKVGFRLNHLQEVWKYSFLKEIN
jgi:hypothetical protein